MLINARRRTLTGQVLLNVKPIDNTALFVPYDLDLTYSLDGHGVATLQGMSNPAVRYMTRFSMRQAAAGVLRDDAAHTLQWWRYDEYGNERVHVIVDLHDPLLRTRFERG